MWIIYLDTSALLKRYIQEAGSEEVRKLLEETDEIATGVITRVETASAIARLVRSQAITAEEGKQVWDEFCEDWEIITRLHVTPQGIERAASLARRYGLCGYDALHLASALLWQERLTLPVLLATFDRPLWLAGREAGIQVWPKDLLP
jgi:predicted nucleic acid-binding protein